MSGVLMQIILGVFVMRTQLGYHFFKFAGGEIDKFLSFTDYGSRLVFGVNHKDHFFVFKVTCNISQNKLLLCFNIKIIIGNASINIFQCNY
jgi:nucleoside permease NupC